MTANELLSKISQENEESDEAALIGNDIVYLRLVKKDLQEKAEKAGFSNGFTFCSTERHGPCAPWRSVEHVVRWPLIIDKSLSIMVL